jgi:hypothetical protein
MTDRSNVASMRSACDAPAREISRTSMGTVVLCGCGNVHLNLEYLTLRFEPQAFRELACLLHFAQHRLDGDAGVAPRRPDPGAPVH